MFHKSINGTLKFEFLHEFSENFLAGHVANIIWHVTVHACAKFEVILNNARSINGPRVANWG